MKEFGKVAFDQTVYISFDNNQRIKDLFSSDLDVERIVMGLELYSGQKINPLNTLLLFDEIQEVPQALTSLKYFNENAPQYQIICAGSLLGVALHQGTSFPVGKVEFLDLYPLNFNEFLMAMGNGQYVLQQIKTIKGLETYYWTNDRGSAEIDFVVDSGTHVIPIEVKAETNLKAKSLKIYHEKFQPPISIRTSMADYKQEDWLLNLPLYAIEEIVKNN